MSAYAALSFFVIVMIFAVTPGPGVFALIARAMSEGVRTCIPMSLGMCISDVIYLLLACFGLSALAENWGGAFIAVRYIGGAYLIYLGYKMFTASAMRLSSEQQQNAASWWASFLQGFLISASNPKVILFYAAFLPTFMDLSQLSARGILLAAVLTFIALMVGLLAVIFGAAVVRAKLKSPSAQRRLNWFSGGIMMGAGVYLAVH